MTMQEVLKQIIKESIAPVLKAKGFKKRGNNFAKTYMILRGQSTFNLQSGIPETK